MVDKLLRLTCAILCAGVVVGCGGSSNTRRVERKVVDPEIQAAKDRAAGKLQPPAPPAGVAAKTPDAAKPSPSTAKTPEAAKAPAASTTAPAVAAKAPAATPAAQPAAVAPATEAPAAVAPAVVLEAKIPDVPSASSVTIEPVPIDAPWSPEKKLEQTKLRMQKIVYAMHEYMKKEGRLPADAIYNKSGEQALLSWRVALLPYLGHEELYAKFNLKTLWNSETGNKKLLTQIPPVYQCPWGSLPDSTMFVIARSPRGLFPGVEGRDPKLATDDWSRTVALLMVDDSRAVPWTKPEDFRLKAGGAPGMLGKLTGGFLAAFADGEVFWLSQSAGREKLPGLFTINGGEKPVSATTVQAPEKAIEPLEKLARMGVDEIPEVPTGTLFPDFNQLARGGSEFMRSSSKGSGNAEAKDDNRAAIPSDEEYKLAKIQLGKVFKEEIEKIEKTPMPNNTSARVRALIPNMTKSRVAELLLSKLELIQSEPVQAYVLLDIAREKSVAAGNYSQAVEATNELSQRYQVDTFKIQAETLLQSANECMTVYRQQVPALRHDALWFVYKSLSLDDFKTASEMYEVIKRITSAETGGGSNLPRMIAQGSVTRAPILMGRGSAARSRRSPTVIIMQKMQSIDKEIDSRRDAYSKVPAALETLKKTPDDPDANLVVGRYKTLVKFDWKDGGKFLIKGSNIKLAFLATWDAKPPADGKSMAELAAEYLTAAEVETGIYERGLKMRALYWYKKAEPTVPGGLLKIQTEKFIKDCNEKYSTEVVNEIMNLFDEKDD